MDYRREIDELRALAVPPVILFHAGFETFSGGLVILPFLTEIGSRVHAAMANRCFGVVVSP